MEFQAVPAVGLLGRDDCADQVDCMTWKVPCMILRLNVHLLNPIPFLLMTLS